MLTNLRKAGGDVYSKTLTMIAIVFVAIAVPRIGELEGMVAPVIKDVTVTNIEPIGDRVWVSGEIEKLRDCVIKEFGWSRVSGIPIETRRVGEVPNNGVGELAYGPIELDTSPQRVRCGELEVMTEHRCHPMWRTVTYVKPTVASELLDDCNGGP